MNDARTRDARWAAWGLGIVSTVGVLVRAWGLSWGLPRVDLHPDELTILQVTQRLSWEALDPGFYSYSGLCFYLNFLSGALVESLGFDLTAGAQLLVNRSWNLLWTPLTCLVLYRAGGELGSPAAGLAAAGLLAATPLHIWDSHFGTTDVALTFWTTCVVWLAHRAYVAPTPIRYSCAGLALGIAIGTKFSGAMAATSLLAASIAATWEGQIRIRRAPQLLMLAALATFVGFLVTSPHSLLQLDETLRAFQTEARHVRAGHYGFDVTPDGWQYRRVVYQLAAALPFSLGVALYVLVGGGLLCFWRSAASSERTVLLSFPVLYFAVTASWVYTPIRYSLPMLPALLLAAAVGLRRSFGELASSRARAGLALGMSLALAHTIAYSVTTTRRFANETRLEAATWAERHLPARARVALVQPIFRESYMPRIRRSDLQLEPLELQNLANFAATSGPGDSRWLCASSLTYGRAYRQGDARGIAAWAQLRAASGRFERVVTFERSYLHRDFYAWLDPLFAGYMVAPTIEFYRVRTESP